MGRAARAAPGRVPPVAPGSEPVDGRLRRDQRAGVLGAVLVILALGGFNALALPPFVAGDESAHTNYALEVAEGRLPLFDERFPPRVPGIRDTLTWTAMHPPLYYMLVAAPLRLGVESGHPLAGLAAARLLTVVLAAAAVVLAARLAGALVPDRAVVPVVGAGALALVPSFSQVGALVYNDALAVLTTAAVLVLVVETLRGGCTRRRLVLLALAAAAAAATRASGLEVAGLAVLAAASPAPAERGQALRQRLRGAATRAAVVAAAVAVTSGWAYLRNVVLYGSPDGSSRAVLLGVRDTPWSETLLPSFWLDQYDQLWGYLTTNLPLPGVLAGLAHALLAAVLVGLALEFVRRLRAGRPAGPLALAWAVMALHVVVTVLAVLSYFNRGGATFGRYFFTLLPLLPVLAAVGLTALPGARRGLPAVLAGAAAAAIAVPMTLLVVAGASPVPGGRSAWEAARLLADAGVPAPQAVLAGLAVTLAAGLLLLTRSVLRLAGRRGG